MFLSRVVDCRYGNIGGSAGVFGVLVAIEGLCMKLGFIHGEQTDLAPGIDGYEDIVNDSGNPDLHAQGEHDSCFNRLGDRIFWSVDERAVSRSVANRPYSAGKTLEHAMDLADPRIVPWQPYLAPWCSAQFQATLRMTFHEELVEHEVLSLVFAAQAGHGRVR